MAGPQPDFGWMCEVQKAKTFLETECRKNLVARFAMGEPHCYSPLANGSWEISNAFLTTARAYPVGEKTKSGLQISPTPWLRGNLALRNTEKRKFSHSPFSRRQH